MTTRETLWCKIYETALSTDFFDRPGKVADGAVAEFDKRFTKQAKPTDGDKKTFTILDAAQAVADADWNNAGYLAKATRESVKKLQRLLCDS